MDALELVKLLEEAFERKNSQYWYTSGNDVVEEASHMIAEVFRGVRESLEGK